MPFKLQPHGLMKKTSTALLLAAGLMALPTALQANQANKVIAGHYPAGAEGLKGASLPPPGLYLRDYNIGYYADQYQNGPPSFN